jgi:uncharacterized SAM-binding protein YcdF (DUF218 family)
MNKEEITNIKPPKPTRKKRILAVGAMVLGFLGVPMYSISNHAQHLLGTVSGPMDSQADCGVVLTGAAGRIREGIVLLSHKQVKKLIISGVHQRATLSDVFPEILFYPEIPLEDIILERRSNSTAANAQQSLAIVEALQCQSILLITSDYHMYRALKTFSLVFPPAIQITPFVINSDRLQRRTGLLATRFWGTVIEEWYKYLFYELAVF